MVLVVTAALVVLLGSACGDDGSDAPKAQPSPGGTGFVAGRFDELPLPPRAEPLGPRREEEGVLTRSWSVRNTTAEEVLGFYERNLGEDWRTRTAVRRLGDAYRGEWQTDGHVLRVSAVPAPAADGDGLPDPEEPVVQLSMQLLPS